MEDTPLLGGNPYTIYMKHILYIKAEIIAVLCIVCTVVLGLYGNTLADNDTLLQSCWIIFKLVNVLFYNITKRYVIILYITHCITYVLGWVIVSLKYMSLLYIIVCIMQIYDTVIMLYYVPTKSRVIVIPTPQVERLTDSQCSICQEDFVSDTPVVILRCQHVFHQTCMIRWDKNKSNCPLCREPV